MNHGHINLPGVDTQQSLIWRGFAPIQLRALLNTSFERKSTHFEYLPLTNGTPFTYQLCIPFN